MSAPAADPIVSAPVVPVVVPKEPVVTPVVQPTEVVVVSKNESSPMITTVAPARDVTEIPVMSAVEEVQANEIVPVESEILEPAASEVVVAEVPTPVVADAPVSTVAAVAPAKETSEEDDLIEGIVNTLIEDDGEGEINKFNHIQFN